MKYAVTILLFITTLGYAQEKARGSIPTKTKVIDTSTKHAVIIGISDYKDKKLSLDYAENDAFLFRDYLSNIEQVPKENISYLDSKSANSRNIYKALKKLMNDAQSGDTAYFYFSGHSDISDFFGKESSFLLASNTNKSEDYFGANDVVRFNDLIKVMNTITDKGAKVIMIMDVNKASFDTLFKDRSKKNMEVIQALTHNFILFLSSNPNQFSYGNSQLKQGYFTYYLVLGLMGAADSNNDHKLMYNELDDFLYENVLQASDKKQTPISPLKPGDVIRTINPEAKAEALKTIKLGFKQKLILKVH